jgi:hypothetical protein
MVKTKAVALLPYVLLVVALDTVVKTALAGILVAGNCPAHPDGAVVGEAAGKREDRYCRHNGSDQNSGKPVEKKIKYSVESHSFLRIFS